MDDVLASIRRIVRAEKDPEGVQDAEPVVPEPGMQTENIAEAEHSRFDESAPLELTPEMMMEGDAEAVSTEHVSQAFEDVQETAEAAMAIDPETIKGMVRDVVMEQLNGGDADGLIRGIIRDELTTGEVGSNISKNVLKLIQSEIGKAMGNS